MQTSVYSSVSDAVFAAKGAHSRYSALSLNDRKEIIESIREVLKPLARKIAEMTVEETQMGNVDDKTKKILLAIEKTPSVEDLITEVNTGNHGMTLYEQASFGVVCAVHPCTNPTATLINNTISILAAGNSVIHCPHPRAIKVSQFVTQIICEQIRDYCGIDNLVVTISEGMMGYTQEIMSHPDVDMVVSTGGNDSLRKALVSGKKVIGAGASNPVTIVDETANLQKAAMDIVSGASFDNNLMCTSEKSIVAIESISSKFIFELIKNEVYFTKNEEEIQKIMKVTITEDNVINKKLEGKSAEEILRQAGIEFKGKVKLIVAQTDKYHPFVTIELLMPVVPLVLAKDFDEALEFAVEIEQGYKHTATIHSNSIENLNRAAHIMQTAIFVKNGSSLLGIGFEKEGNTSFTVANVTGEGTVTARHFTKRRRCTLTSGFTLR